MDRRTPLRGLRDLRSAGAVHRHRRRAHPEYPPRHRRHLAALPPSLHGGGPHRTARLPDPRPGDVRLRPGPVAFGRDDARHRPGNPARPHGRRDRHHHPPARRRGHHPAQRVVHDARGAAAAAPLFEAAAASGHRSAVTPYGGKLAGRYDLGMLCVMAGSPNGYDALDYNWQLANAEAAARGCVMDRANFRIMAPFHIAETREKAIENVRAGFEKWQLYSYSVNPEGGAAIGMPSIEEINAGGRGAIGTPDDALRVLENYWAKTGGFGCILMLAHDWADWEATKRSYELFARYVLPRFEERSAWRSQSMDWMRARRDEFSAKRKAAAASAVERHFADKTRDAAK